MVQGKDHTTTSVKATPGNYQNWKSLIKYVNMGNGTFEITSQYEPIRTLQLGYPCTSRIAGRGKDYMEGSNPLISSTL